MVFNNDKYSGTVEIMLANPAIARLLHVPFANCLPHSLNLVLQSFTKAFTVTSFMPLLASFVNLGMSMDRRQLITAYGLRLT